MSLKTELDIEFEQKTGLPSDIFYKGGEYEDAFEDQNGNRIFFLIGHQVVSFYDKQATECSFQAYVKKCPNTGLYTLSFSVSNRLRNNSKHPSIHPSLMLAKALEHFASEGTVIEALAGEWYDDPGWEDNYEMYVDAKSQGADSHEAALSTWTGKQAQKFGFTAIKSVIEEYGHVQTLFVHP